MSLNFTSLNPLLQRSWNYLKAFYPQNQTDTGHSSRMPTYADVCVARAMLKSLKLPTELVLTILDLAEYEPTLEFGSYQSHVASASMGRASAAQLCLIADVLTHETICSLEARSAKPRIREIEFDIHSHDQGWTSQQTDGTFATSSWLEVSILRSTEPILNLSSEDPIFKGLNNPEEILKHLRTRNQTLVERPEGAKCGAQDDEGHRAWYLQGNRVSTSNSENYRVVWRRTDYEGNEGAGDGLKFLDLLQQGDIILVWARAKYPGWQCTVENLTLTARFSFD